MVPCGLDCCALLRGETGELSLVQVLLQEGLRREEERRKEKRRMKSRREEQRCGSVMCINLLQALSIHVCVRHHSALSMSLTTLYPSSLILLHAP